MSEIQVERSDRGVATVWLSNPRHLNALSNSMIIGLCEELPRLADDTTCRAIVMRGRGGVFCAGRELGDVKALQGAGHEDIARMYGYMQKMNEVIYYSPHPVISVVEKYAFGIATMLVSWSDIALAEEGAMLGYPEVHHGITPYGAVPTMLNMMNQKAMLDLLLTGRKMSAAEALRLGILTRAVPADQLAGELDACARGYLPWKRGSNSPVQAVREGMRDAYLPAGHCGCHRQVHSGHWPARDAEWNRRISRQAEGKAAWYVRLFSPPISAAARCASAR